MNNLWWNWLKRDWRSGEWRVLLLALFIGVGSVSTTGFMSDRFNRALTERGGAFLGGDLLLVSPKPVAVMQWRDAPPVHSDVIDMMSMASAGDAFQMINLRAVDHYYPVRGKVLIRDSENAPAQSRSAQPQRGSVYVGADLLSLLNTSIGQTVDIGESAFRIAGVVDDEPGRAGAAVFGMAPRVFMHLDDVPLTGLLQPGSRVSYLYFFAGREDDIVRFSDALKSRIEPSQRVLGGREGSEALGSAFTRTDRFFNLAGLVSLLLSAVAIALASRRYAQRHFDAAALLRCLGMPSTSVRTLFATQLLAVGMMGAVLGVLLGAVIQDVLLRVLAAGLVNHLPAMSWRPALAGVGSGMLALLAASLPSLLQLSRVPPLRVLRRELGPVPLSAWLVLLIVSFLFIALAYWYAQQWRLVFAFLIGLMLLAVVVTLLAYLSLWAGQWAQRGTRGAMRFGLAQLARHRRSATIQTGAFALAMFLMMAVAMVRTDLLDAWREQMPDDAPNHFLINIAPEQTTDVREFFAAEQITVTQLYPMIRGRLVAKNGMEMAQAVPENAREDNALKRELNLTFTTELPRNNALTDGEWHGKKANAGLSLEEKLATRLNIQLGDTLTFKMADREISAPVTSLRSVRWESMQPNFFVIFSDGYLDDSGATYMGAARVPSEKNDMMLDFVKRFPTITLIGVDRIIRDVQNVIAQVVMAIEALLVFLLLAGVAVLMAALLASLDERYREAVLLRTLGAGRAFLHRSLLTEFLSLGLMAGILAAAGTEAFSWYVGDTLFDLSFRWHPWLWMLAPTAGAGLVALFGWLATRRIAQVSPITALRETG